MGKIQKSKRIIAIVIILAMVLSTLGVATVSTFADTTPTITVKNASNGKATLKVGEKYKLGAKTSSGKITYKSSKPSVVSVSKKGVLKAKKPGKSTITITAKCGKEKIKKKIKVKVTENYISGNYITISVSNIIPLVGTTAKASSRIKPVNASNKNVTYSCSNKSIATVDINGNIKIKKAGKAIITAKSCANPKLKASVEINAKNSFFD